MSWVVVEGLASKKHYARIVHGRGVRPKAYMFVKGETGVVGICTPCTKNEVSR